MPSEAANEDKYPLMPRTESSSWAQPPPRGVLTIQDASSLYKLLVQHQKEQSNRFDKLIQKRDEQRVFDEENERIRRKEAEKERLDKEKKEQEEIEGLLRRGGKGARAQLAQIRARKAEEQAKKPIELPVADTRPKIYEKAWPGGVVTSTKLESAFANLPEQPSGAQARYFFEQSKRYCDESKGPGYLTTDGFRRIVSDLGHLQADLVAENKETLQRIFKTMDRRRRGEISLADILVQIETDERELIMPLVDALLKTSDANNNGLLDINEFSVFHASWMQLHRIFEVYDDCRLEETWSSLDDFHQSLSFTDIELLSSLFLGIKSKVQQGRHQVAHIGPVTASLGDIFQSISLFPFS
jgi:Ca2+-binding EF-hand superfamily protein